MTLIQKIICTFCVYSVHLEELDSSTKDLLYEIRCRFEMCRMSKPEPIEDRTNHLQLYQLEYMQIKKVRPFAYRVNISSLSWILVTTQKPFLHNNFIDVTVEMV